MLKPSLNGDGKDKLEGNAGADRFYFSGDEPFAKSKADQVVDFGTKEGDQIVIADQIFFNPIITNSVLQNLSRNPDTTVANSKKPTISPKRIMILFIINTKAKNPLLSSTPSISLLEAIGLKRVQTLASVTFSG